MNTSALTKFFLVTVIIMSAAWHSWAQDSTFRATSKPAPANPRPVSPAYGTRAGTYAQPAIPAPVNTDKSLTGQYQYLVTKLYVYQRPQLAAFYKNITDTIRTQRQQLKEANAKLAEQTKTVKGLQADVTAKDQSLNDATTNKDAINLLGLSMSKTTYNMIMWGLVIAFGAIAVLFMLQAGGARREAKYRVKLYEDLDEEHKVYKQKANEKEKKLARELQTARNQLEDLTGNPGY